MEEIKSRIISCQSLTEFDREVRPLIKKNYERFDVSDRERREIEELAMRKQRSLKRRGKK